LKTKKRDHKDPFVQTINLTLPYFAFRVALQKKACEPFDWILLAYFERYWGCRGHWWWFP